MQLTLPITINEETGEFTLQQDVAVDLWPRLKMPIRVPMGFISDGASIPRFAWSIVGHPMQGPSMRPAVVHDWLCVNATSYMQRKLADTILLALLAERHNSLAKRWAMYIAVRLYAVWLLVKFTGKAWGTGKRFQWKPLPIKMDQTVVADTVAAESGEFAWTKDLIA